MANILEYILSLKDQTTKTLANIGINSDRAYNKFNALKQQANEVSRVMKVFGGSVGALRQKLELLKNERDWIPAKEINTIRAYNSEIKKLTAQISKLETINGSKVKTWAKDAFNGLPDLVKNPLVLAGVGIGAAFKVGMQKDLQLSNMTTMFKGNEQAAKQMYSKIGAYAKATPYGKAGLVEAQNRMMAFGISSDSSFEKLKQIGDIAMGDSQKMDTLSLAFGKLSSTGRAQGDEINMMIEAGFNPLQIIYERTGESVDSLRDRMRKGTLTAKEVSKAFEWATDKQGLYFKGAERGSKTLAGVWSNIQEGFAEMLIKFYDVILPLALPLANLASSIIDGIGVGVDWVVGLFKSWMGAIQDGSPIVIGITALIASLSLGMAIQYMWTKRLVVWNGIKAAWDWVVAGSTTGWAAAQNSLNAALLKNPVGWVIFLIIALIGVIFYVIYAFDGWGAAWGHLMDFLKYSWEYFKSSFEITWLTVQDKFLIGIEAMQKAWYNLQSLWDEEGANAGLAKIEAQQNERAKKLAATKNQAIIEKVAAATAASKIIGKDGVHSNGKGFADITNSVKIWFNNLTPNSPNEKIKGYDPNGSDDTKKSNNAIATGGTKNTTINVHIGKQIEHFTLMTNSLKEGTAKLKEIIVDEMTRALAMSQSMAQ